jgi:hypothetical protein
MKTPPLLYQIKICVWTKNVKKRISAIMRTDNEDTIEKLTL